MLVVVHPAQNAVEGAFQKAEPPGQRNDPEVFVPRNRAKGVAEFHLDDVGLGLDDFFLGIGVDQNGNEEAHKQHRREQHAVNLDVVKRVVPRDKPCDNAHVR